MINNKVIQKPVTFEEVLNSDKKFRVEHYKTNVLPIFKDFIEIDSFLFYISQYFVSEDIKK